MSTSRRHCSGSGEKNMVVTARVDDNCAGMEAAERENDEKDIFALLEDPPEFKVDRDFEYFKKRLENIPYVEECKRAERERIREKEMFAEKRKSRMNTSQLRYAYDTRKKVLHDRSCRWVSKIPDEFFEMCRDFDHGMNLCRKCHIRMLIRACIDDQEDVELAEQILRRLYAKREDMVSLLNRKNVEIRCVSNRSLEVKLNDDTWRIVAPRKEGEELTLLHNNYRIEDGKRIIERGFHRQCINGRKSFKAASRIIVDYKAQFHIEEIYRSSGSGKSESDMYLEMAPDNDVQIEQDNFNRPTAVRLRRFSLISDRYMFIDTKAKHHENVFRKRKLRYKVIYESYCDDFAYGVVICSIPKWYRSKMFAAINNIKRDMYKEGHGRGYLCGICMIRHLKNRGMRFDTYI